MINVQMLTDPSDTIDHLTTGLDRSQENVRKAIRHADTKARKKTVKYINRQILRFMASEVHVPQKNLQKGKRVVQKVKKGQLWVGLNPIYVDTLVKGPKQEDDGVDAKKYGFYPDTYVKDQMIWTRIGRNNRMRARYAFSDGVLRKVGNLEVDYEQQFEKYFSQELPFYLKQQGVTQ